MKKLKLFLLFAISAMTLCSCNKTILDLNYQFTHAHLISQNQCMEIKEWDDYSDSCMVQIKTKEGLMLLAHSSELVLISSQKDCPYCN